MDKFDGELYIKEIIDNYFNDTSKENTLCINGPWGYGKTTFVEKLIKKSFENEDYKTIIFNLWEYEISDNIFRSLIIDLAYELGFERKAKINIKKLLLNISKAVIKKIIKIDTDKISKFIKDYVEVEDITQYDSFKNILVQLVKIITIQIAKLKAKNQKVIVVFDEMDRTTSDQLNIFLNVIKNIFFRLKDNIFFIVCCNTEHVDEMLREKNNDEPFTAKIFDRIINIEYIINKIDDKNIYLQKYWRNEGNFRKRNKIINAVKKLLNNDHNNKYNQQLNLIYTILYDLKYSENKKYKMILNNARNIHTLNEQIIDLLKEFKNELDKTHLFELHSKAVYKRIHKLAPLKDSYSYYEKNEEVLLYVEIKRSQLVPLSFFIPFFVNGKVLLNQMSHYLEWKYLWILQIHL